MDTKRLRGEVKKAEEKGKDALTVLWNDLPQWMQDNHYILSGYRPATNSYQKSAASLGYLHNETVNIYTHLIGAILAVFSAITLYTTIWPRFLMSTTEDVLVFSCFFLGAVACLGMSATYHTISNHSEAVTKFGNRLDYVGIVLLIWGSFIPSIYFGFSAEPELIRLYWTMVSLTIPSRATDAKLEQITSIGAGTLVLVLYPKFRSPEWRPVRALAFVAMGLSAVVPVLHGLQMYGYEQVEKQIGLSWVVSQGVLYITGATLYAVSCEHELVKLLDLTLIQSRIPERWRPGAFDIWGSSHQIFHVLVVLAAAAHLVGLLKAFDYEHRFRVGVMSGYGNARKLGGP